MALQLNFIVASELSITSASQIGQTSATNLSGVVLAHNDNGSECAGAGILHPNVSDGVC